MNAPPTVLYLDDEEIVAWNLASANEHRPGDHVYLLAEGPEYEALIARAKHTASQPWPDFYLKELRDLLAYLTDTEAGA